MTPELEEKLKMYVIGRAKFHGANTSQHKGY